MDNTKLFDLSKNLTRLAQTSFFKLRDINKKLFNFSLKENTVFPDASNIEDNLNIAQNMLNKLLEELLELEKRL